jgi:hypothetical protein
MSDAPSSPNVPGSQQPQSPAVATVNAPLDLASVKYLMNKLEEAELLLAYAAEVGIEVKDEIRHDVLNARAESAGGKMSEQTADNLLTGLTALAANLRPVTVRSLKCCLDGSEASKREIRKTLRFYLTFVIVCAVPIVICSLVTFVFNHFADNIKKDVTAANLLALKLQTDFGPSSTNESQTNDSAAPPNSPGTNGQTADQIWWGSNQPPHGLEDKSVIEDLREFAATMREIDEYAKMLNHFVFNAARDPFHDLRTDREADRQIMKQNFELAPGLDVLLSHEFAKKVAIYQDVRAFGEAVQETGSVFYGAFATYILPILYALLGSSAYLLRSYESQIKNRTYVGSGRNAAHFLVAGISGMVVGLFNNVTQSVTIPPFAEAFLVGYAVDVFFTFLEGLLQMFQRNAGTPPRPNVGP